MEVSVMNNEVFNVPLITGKTNSTIVKISKLADKKYRNKEKLFIFDGIKLFLEAVDFNAPIKYIIVDNNADLNDNVCEKIRNVQAEGVSILCVERHVFEKLTDENSPQGIITVCGFMQNLHRFFTKAENVFYENEKLIILESVRDPGNFGAILRNAVAFGIDRLIVSSDCVDIYSPKVIRASMGAFFKLKIDVVNELTSSVVALKKSGRRVLAAALEKNSLVLGKDAITSRDVFALGNEGHGLSREIIDNCTDSIFIPIKENTESLNVAIAGAIIMWEISK